MKRLLKKSLRRFDAYIPGEQPQEPGWVKLNTNENPYPPSPKVIKALELGIKGPLQVYPDPSCKILRATIAKLYKVAPEQILIGNGSDETLRLILEAYLDKGEKVLFPEPSYPLYKTLAEIQNGKPVSILLTEKYDLPAWKKQWQGKVLFIANPNSPTGGYFSNQKISRVCQLFKGLVVLDEAYVDFAPSYGLPLLKKYKNLIINQTLSKAYSLAGMRIGFVIASKEIIDGLYLVKDSYNVNRLSQVAATAALLDQKYFQTTRNKILKTRGKLVKELKKLGFKVYPTAANFIFASPPDKNGKALYLKLKANKILVRFWNTPQLKHAVRITVGNDRDIDLLIKKLRSIY